MSEAFSNLLYTELYLFSNDKSKSNQLSQKYNLNIITLGKYSVISILTNFLSFLFFSNFQKKTDIIYTRSIYINFLASLINAKVYYEIHNTQRTFIHKYLFKLSKLNRNSKYILITKNLLNVYKLKSNFLILPSASVLNLNENTVKYKRKYIQCKNNKLSICYVGSDHPGKGVDRVYLLSKLLPDFNFEIVGPNFDNFDWPSNCRIRGRLSSKNALEIMSESHIFLLPNHLKVLINSKRDIGEFTSPLKLFEYFSSFGCVLASNIDILKEVLNEDNSVLLTESNFVNEAKECIINLNNDREKLLKIANNSYEIFINNYTWDIRAKKVYETF
jgi:glycosyltransferase involved in cell wall biosynthesis